MTRNHGRTVGRTCKLLAGALAAAVMTAAPVASRAADAPDAGAAATSWPQWRGPTATGVNPTASPPTKWGESQNVKWKVALPGRGSSTPVIWENQVFIQTAIPTGKKSDPAAPPAAGGQQPGVPAAQVAPPPDGPPSTRPTGPGGGRRGPGGFGGPGGPGGRRGGPGGMRAAPPTEVHQFVLLCLDRQTGKELWRQVAREELPHEGHHKDHGFSSHSPMTDGKHVYAYFGSRGLHCYDMAGNLKWSKDLGRMSTKMSFGEGSSPVLADGVVVVNWDHEGEDFIAGLDAETGKELWRTPRNEDTTWATPLVVRHEGQSQVVVPATGKIRSYDLKTGKQIWECGGMTANVIPTPVAGDGVVYVISGFRGAALLAIKLGRTGDLTGTDAIVWSHAKATPYVPSPLLYGDRLYFFSGNQGVLSVFDVKTGKPVIDTERVEGLDNVYASPIGAGGHVYLVARSGTTTVVKHGGDKLEVVSENKLDERIDASPAAVGKELFLRGERSLYCIAEK